MTLRSAAPAPPSASSTPSATATVPAPTSGERVLVVDDEPDIVALVAYHLAKASYRVATAGTGADAIDMARRERPALIVLDLMLPGMSGFDVLEQLRADENTRDIAVLMLTARREEPDRIRGLSLGADDYLTKPFSPPELVLRVGNILRRVQQVTTAAPDLVVIGAITIDRGAMSVSVDGERIDLTPTEFKLLLTLAERRGRVQGRGHLLETVWEAAPDIQTRTVDMHVQRLRAKLGAAGDLIETVRGFGYRLRASHSRGA
jgi:two-component system, OmpR family, phosphate regulon response regulator PhoB